MSSNHNDVFELPYTIGADEIEAEYHHVHHAQSLRLLERARLAFMEAIECPNEAFIKEDLFLVITSIEIQYKRELFEGDVVVTCEAPRIVGKKVIVDQRIINPKGKTAIEAVVTSMFMNGSLRRAVLPPEKFQTAFCSEVSK